MYFNKSILLVVAAALVGHAVDSSGQSNPTITPSTFCVHTNEQLTIKGIGYSPGEQITVFLISSHYRYPLWTPTADTNGEFSADITFRSNIYMEGPRAVQVYSFQGHGTNIVLNIWFQTYNTNNTWNAFVTGVSVQPSSYPGVSRVYVISAIAPNNTYQFQTATNLVGAWTFIGFPTPSDDSNTNYADGFLMPEAPQRFFRVANPYLPCPCDF